MTWKEFKDKVESLGIENDTKINTIEIDCISCNLINVCFNPSGNVDIFIGE